MSENQKKSKHIAMHIVRTHTAHLQGPRVNCNWDYEEGETLMNEDGTPWGTNKVFVYMHLAEGLRGYGGVCELFITELADGRVVVRAGPEGGPHNEVAQLFPRKER